MLHHGGHGGFTEATVLIAAALVAFAYAVPADGQTRAGTRLAAAKKLSCEFSLMATGTWKGGAPEVQTKSSTLSIGFDSIDVNDGTARSIGAFGPFEIIVQQAYGTLHFLQSFKDGPLYITTVFPKETTNGRWQAVHTRHEYTEVSLPGFTSRPEQYYGECTAE